MELFFHIILTSIVPILLLTLMGVLLDRFTNTKQTKFLFIFTSLYSKIFLCHQFNP